MIHPEIWESEDFSKLSNLAKLMFIGMFSLADDEGKGRAKAVYLKSVIFPYDECLRLADVEKGLSEIASCMSVSLYTRDGNKYYKLDKWSKWQRVDKPQPSKIPDPDPEPSYSEASYSEASPETVWNDSSLKEEKRSEEKRNEDKKSEDKRVEKREEENIAPRALLCAKVAEVASEASAIIEHLNSRLGSAYKPDSKATQGHIKARLKEGFTLEDFKTVIDKKAAEWENRPDMAQYLRPQTLFGTKFEAYLNQPWSSSVAGMASSVALPQSANPTKAAIAEWVAKGEEQELPYYTYEEEIS